MAHASADTARHGWPLPNRPNRPKPDRPEKESRMPGAPTTFIPADIDASSWESIEPLFDALRDREVATPEGFDRWLEDRSELEAACSEAGARLYIDMTCHTESEPATRAYLDFVEKVQPKIRVASFELDRRQHELAEAFGKTDGRYAVLHRDTAADVELYREENVPILTNLSALSQRYQSITGAMTVEFDGAERTMPQMAPYQESTDRAQREAAWRATAERRLQDREPIDDIMDSMVHMRHAMARNAGLDGYVEYAFRSMHRFDYTPDDCARFHDAVEAEVMPFMAGLDDRRRRDLGLDELRPWDLAVDRKGRDPLRPFEGGAELVAKTRAVFGALDPELAEMFGTLGEGTNDRGIAGDELLDLDSRAGKAPGGYQYMLDRERRPFIFMNAAGVHRDVETMVHEAGHAFHSLLCADEPLIHYRHSPIEFAEVASMTMELLTMPHWGVPGGFYEDANELARAQRRQLEGALSIFPWIATIDAFQHWIYNNHTHTRAERTEAWNALMDRFGYSGHRVAWDDDTAPARDARWQAQPHPFDHPLYYIEYGIAQLGALQLWARSREHGEAAALESYKRALKLGGSAPLPELFRAADIEFDFSPEIFARLREKVEAALDELPGEA